MLRRQPYREEGSRTRTEYRLIDKGFDLYPVLTAALAWGDRYLADPEGSPIQLVHRDCGAPVQAPLRCAAGHEVASPRDVVPRPAAARGAACEHHEGSPRTGEARHPHSSP